MEESQSIEVATADISAYDTTEKREDKLSEIAKCSIRPSDLIYGRWTNVNGQSVTDFSNQPLYLNLTGKQSEIDASLNELVTEMYDEPEPLPQGNDIDYERLLTEDQSNSINIRPVLFKEAIIHYSRMFRVLT